MINLSNHPSTACLFNNNNYIWESHKGNRVLFWEDIWSKDMPLALIFPRLYRICKYKNKYIQDMRITWENLNSPDDLWIRNLYT